MVMNIHNFRVISGPVETGPTGPVATGLLRQAFIRSTHKKLMGWLYLNLKVQCINNLSRKPLICKVAE